MRNFALIGAAGYIAPRHMRAIKETGNNLSACLDPNDSIGILDSYFPEAKYFKEFERFDRFIEKENRSRKESFDFLSICSPNYLHDSHIRFGLRSNLDVICEKPIVLNPWNVDSLIELENESEKSVSSVLQLRYHPSIIELKNLIETSPNKQKYEVDLTYITGRGNWYLNSWKGNIEKSGGISTNIGVHFFDMLHFLFGKVQENIMYLKEPTKESGYLEFEKARVRWFLSIDASDIRHFSSDTAARTFRSITYDGTEIEFSHVFDDLHTSAYEEILQGNGYGLEDSLHAIEIVSSIRNATIKNLDSASHPYLTK